MPLGYGVTEGQTYKSAFKKSKFNNEPTVVWGFTADPSYDSDDSNSTAAKPRVINMLEVAIGLLSTWLCCHFGVYADIHPALVLTAITFPVAFSINASFQRRELSLHNLASQKAAARALLLIHRDWALKFEGLGGPFVRHTYDAIKKLIEDQHSYLILRNERYKHLQLEKIYASVNFLSCQNDLCRAAGVPPPMTSQPTHRLFYMIEMFERLRVVCDYRTPSALRSYKTIFMAFIAVMLSPNFAFLGLKASSPVIPYFVAALVAFTFGCLSTVQRMLENPFDNTQDDINLEAIDHWTVKTLEPIVGDKQFTPIGRSVVTREAHSPSSTHSPGGFTRKSSSKANMEKQLGERRNSLPKMHAKDLTGISNLSLSFTAEAAGSSPASSNSPLMVSEQKESPTPTT